MTGYRVAIIPGDGVGTEVAAEAVRVLEAAAKRFGFDLETENFLKILFVADQTIDVFYQVFCDFLRALAGPQFTSKVEVIGNDRSGGVRGLEKLLTSRRRVVR